MLSHYESLQTAASSLPSAKPWLQQAQKASLEKFIKAGYPTRKQETWAYTSARPFSQTAFERPVPPAAPFQRDISELFLQDAPRLVFINGTFNPSLSHLDPSLGLLVEPLHENLDHPSFSEAFLSEPSRPRTAFEELNRAFLSGGSILETQAQKRYTTPIQILYINDQLTAPSLVSPQNIIRLKAGSELTVVESYFSYFEENFSCAQSMIQIERGARLNLLTEKVLSSHSLHIGSHRFQMHQDAQLYHFALTIGGKTSRSETQVAMLSPGANACLDGLYLGRQATQIDHITWLDHLAPDTLSRQLYKGLLYDQSKAVFQGHINIAKHATRSAAHQLNKNLLLSSEAEVNTRPQLNIDTDDVACSHGATIGQLDPLQKFYLQSRGIPGEAAEAMLAKAFVRDLEFRMPSPILRQRYHKVLQSFAGIEI